MDEPFSSLDELTAASLRAEVAKMLRTKSITVNSIIMVTHNVEEAVELSDELGGAFPQAFPREGDKAHRVQEAAEQEEHGIP